MSQLLFSIVVSLGAKEVPASQNYDTFRSPPHCIHYKMAFYIILNMTLYIYTEITNLKRK